MKYLTDNDYEAAAKDLGCEVAIIKAIADVESRGAGFLSNGKPKILLEGHWFHKFTNGIYDKMYPTISYPKWTRKHYKGGVAEYDRYDIAYKLDEEAAMKSTSWGKFQIMGFNYRSAGYDDVRCFVEDMMLSEYFHLKAFCNFLKNEGILQYAISKNWKEFARRYNGPGYATNKYDIKLENSYNKYKS